MKEEVFCTDNATQDCGRRRRRKKKGERHDVETRAQAVGQNR